MKSASYRQLKYADDINAVTGVPLPKIINAHTIYNYIKENKDKMYEQQQCEDKEENQISFEQSDNKGKLTIYFKNIPKHCGECPLYLNNVYVDDEPTWGDGIHYYCPFDCETFGCLVERPKDCPIEEIKTV